MSLVGRLEDLALADIFQILSVGKKTGTLVIKSTGRNAFVVFRDGLVVRAEADVLETTMGEDLLAADVISKALYSMAEEVKKKLPDKSFAEICLELGAVKKEQLDRIVRKRIQKVVFHLLLWTEGEFRFELDDMDNIGLIAVRDRGWVISKGMSPEYLLMEGARVYDETVHQSFIPDDEVFDTGGENETGTESFQGSGRKDISSLRALTQELRFPNSTSEITLLILRFASDIFQRGVLFMVSQHEMAGLGQFGLEIERADEKIRETVITPGDSAFFREILKNMHAYKGPLAKDDGTEFLIKLFGGKWPREVVLFPIVAERSVVALLYCDNLTTGEPVAETEGLEIFIEHAGMALEKAVLQRKLLEMGGN